MRVGPMRGSRFGMRHMPHLTSSSNKLRQCRKPTAAASMRALPAGLSGTPRQSGFGCHAEKSGKTSGNRRCKTSRRHRVDRATKTSSLQARLGPSLSEQITPNHEEIRDRGMASDTHSAVPLDHRQTHRGLLRILHRPDRCLFEGFAGNQKKIEGQRQCGEGNTVAGLHSPDIRPQDRREHRWRFAARIPRTFPRNNTDRRFQSRNEKGRKDQNSTKATATQNLSRPRSTGRAMAATRSQRQGISSPW
mmetsp:Transcript_8756/g.21370  ORF Transcript_8756/g.21370 Transcript_8756/m.21370 type:complete len:248 (-) Transcript_8756:23-766(-)